MLTILVKQEYHLISSVKVTVKVIEDSKWDVLGKKKYIYYILTALKDDVIALGKELGKVNLI